MKKCANCYWFNGKSGDFIQFCDTHETDVYEEDYCYRWKEKGTKPKIIVINGMGGSGKSTFVALCHEIDSRVIETSTVDFVKQIALQAGWDGVKDQKGRRLLSDIKDALERYDDVPNKKIDEFIQSHPDNIIFVNAREPHNIQYYKDKYNALTILVTNPNTQIIEGNHADENVYEYEYYDFTIRNEDSITKLKDKAKIFMDYVNSPLTFFNFHDIIDLS